MSAGEERAPLLLAGALRLLRALLAPLLVVRMTGCCCFRLSVGVMGGWRGGVSSVNRALRKLQICEVALSVGGKVLSITRAEIF